MKFFLIQEHRHQFARPTRSTMREAEYEFKWSARHHPIITTATSANNLLLDHSVAKRSGGISTIHSCLAAQQQTLDRKKLELPKPKFVQF
jgi:hypothetical protein